MSHGFGGWDTQFSNLAEQVASHGYIVASINHADRPVEGVTSFFLSFGNVLVDRTLDKRQILLQILEDAPSGSQAYAAQIDSDNVGLIGYSMGRYGAIASAGASYDFANDPLSNNPATAKAEYLNVPTADSNNSKWPIGFGEQLNGKMAGSKQPDHWKGFQRRRAVGLEMYRMDKSNK